MAFLIVLKWSIPWNFDEKSDYYVGKAPSIINIFIKMALKPGTWDAVRLIFFSFSDYILDYGYSSLR